MPVALHGPEPAHRHFHRVGGGRDVREHVVAGRVGDRGRDFVPRASLMSTTVAPGTTPPCVLDRAGMLPVVICAEAGSALTTNATRHAQTILRVDLTIIELLPPKGADLPLDLQSPTCNGLQESDWCNTSYGRVNRHFALRNMGLQCETSPHFPSQICAFSARRHLLFPADRIAAAASTTRLPSSAVAVCVIRTYFACIGANAMVVEPACPVPRRRSSTPCRSSRLPPCIHAGTVQPAAVAPVARVPRLPQDAPRPRGRVRRRRTAACRVELHFGDGRRLRQLDLEPHPRLLRLAGRPRREVQRAERRARVVARARLPGWQHVERRRQRRHRARRPSRTSCDRRSRRVRARHRRRDERADVAERVAHVGRDRGNPLVRVRAHRRHHAGGIDSAFDRPVHAVQQRLGHVVPMRLHAASSSRATAPSSCPPRARQRGATAVVTVTGEAHFLVDPLSPLHDRQFRGRERRRPAAAAAPERVRAGLRI